MVELATIVVTTASGALSATVGVIVGGIVTRRAQDRHWMRDKELAAYDELLRQYATFTSVLKRAHGMRADWEYDWAVWSAALTSASLIAPDPVARAIDEFTEAIGGFLSTVVVDTKVAALSEPEFEEAMLPPARAQLAFVNAARRSMGKDRGALTVWLGGSLTSTRGV